VVPENIHTHPMEIPRGWGVSKAKTFEGKYEAKPEFLEGWGFKVKTILGGGMDISGNPQFNLRGILQTKSAYHNSLYP